MTVPSIRSNSFDDLAKHAMHELIAQGSIDHSDSLPDITMDEMLHQLASTAQSVVREPDETSEQYAERLIYFAVKDAVEIAANVEQELE